MYCKYEHAALVATGGYLDELADPEDSRTMVFCALSGVEALASIGAAMKGLDGLQQRVVRLSRRRPDRLIRKR